MQESKSSCGIVIKDPDVSPNPDSDSVAGGAEDEKHSNPVMFIRDPPRMMYFITAGYLSVAGTKGS